MAKRMFASFLLVSVAIAVTACGDTTSSSTSTSASNAGRASAAARTTSTGQAPTALSNKTVTAPLEAPQRPGIHDTYDEDDTASRKVEERDDEEIEIYGRPATAAEYRSAAGFAKSYFAAAAAEDGATACTLLVPPLAKAIAGDYEKPSDPSYLRGKTCAQVMTKLFKHRHKLMAAEAAGLEVTDVRVSRTTKTAFVLLAFKGIRERRFMGVERFGKAWKLEALMDSQYP
jgi:hypothetical protein